MGHPQNSWLCFCGLPRGGDAVAGPTQMPVACDLNAVPAFRLKRCDQVRAVPWMIPAGHGHVRVLSHDAHAAFHGSRLRKVQSFLNGGVGLFEQGAS